MLLDSIKQHSRMHAMHEMYIAQHWQFALLHRSSNRSTNRTGANDSGSSKHCLCCLTSDGIAMLESATLSLQNESARNTCFYIKFLQKNYLMRCRAGNEAVYTITKLESYNIQGKLHFKKSYSSSFCCAIYFFGCHGLAVIW